MTLTEKIAMAVVDGDSDLARALAGEIVREKLDLNEVIVRGLNRGMQVVGEKYEMREFFLPEIIVAADALYEALAVFRPHLERGEAPRTTIVMGVVRGDIHDIGKNVTKLFFETAGYNVVDCGRNVPRERFLEAIKAHGAQVLALSTLMSPTLKSIQEVVASLEEQGLREETLVLVGGAAASEKFARDAGVLYFKDGFAAIQFLNQRFPGGQA